MDLTTFLVDDLLQLARTVGDRINDREYIRSIGMLLLLLEPSISPPPRLPISAILSILTKPHNQKPPALKTNSPAIFALLSSGTRVLTRYNFRGLRQTENTATTHIQNAQQGTPTEPNQLQVLRSLKTIFDSSPVKLFHAEKMISDVSGSVSAAYHTLTEIERLTCERDIFINNEIPVVLGSAVERLLRDAQALMRDVDLAALYFHDLSWLGLDDDMKSIASRKSRRIDAIRKAEIQEGRPLRQCTRCCSVTEDFTNSRQMSTWLVSMQRMCFCGSLWMVVKR